MHEIFRKFANLASAWTGSVYAFSIAIVVIAGWAITGPIFAFSDTWQLIINTGTTIVTFLMVFLIQNTQNRDNAALHAKLDELIVHTLGARNELAAAEELSEDELQRVKRHFREVAKKGGTHDIADGHPADGTRRTRNGSSKRRSRASSKTAKG
jgi:low affinity Fe/Cu permease